MINKKTAAIIVAGGTGTRFGGDLPKQYVKTKGRALLAHTLQPFVDHPDIKLIQVVIHPDARDLYDEAIEGLDLLPPVAGGATRQTSVFEGLKALAVHRPDFVMIHDAARPNLTSLDLDNLIKSLLAGEQGAILASPVTDTIKQVEDGYITKTIPRRALFAAQTPQAFPFEIIYGLHQKAPHNNFTDDSMLLEEAGIRVKTIQSQKNNIKITKEKDFLFLDRDV